MLSSSSFISFAHLSRSDSKPFKSFSAAESNEQIGKNIGDDLSGGKITLPFIYAFQNCSDSKKDILKDIIQKRKIEDFLILKDIIFETNALEMTQNKAIEYVNLAKE